MWILGVRTQVSMLTQQTLYWQSPSPRSQSGSSGGSLLTVQLPLACSVILYHSGPPAQGRHCPKCAGVSPSQSSVKSAHRLAHGLICVGIFTAEVPSSQMTWVKFTKKLSRPGVKAAPTSPEVALNLLCHRGWPWAPRYLPPSASQVMWRHTQLEFLISVILNSHICKTRGNTTTCFIRAWKLNDNIYKLPYPEWWAGCTAITALAEYLIVLD